MSHLRIEQVGKRFGGVQALHQVSLTFDSTQVTALLGHNGAGKSTLISILSGASTPDEGRVILDGEVLQLKSTVDARRKGIVTIYQELSLIPSLSVQENLFLYERSKSIWVNYGHLLAKYQEVCQVLNINIPIATPVHELSRGQCQLVEIVRSVMNTAKFIIMDEPTASLSNFEVLRLFEIIEDLKWSGVGVIFVSHKLDEVLRICDKASILRDGQLVAEINLENVAEDELITVMLGQESVPQEIQTRNKVVQSTQNPVLQVSDLNMGQKLKDINFELFHGEILGITGLVGSGRSELAKSIYGDLKYDSGIIKLYGNKVQFNRPEDAVKAGLGFVSEDRKGESLILEQSIRHNMLLPSYKHLHRLGFLRTGSEKTVHDYVAKLSIKLNNIHDPVGSLSGGNQQKVALAKWMMVKPQILILDEPTHGVDMRSVKEIHQLIREWSDEGMSVILITSEFKEAKEICDRILVMHGGRIVSEVTPDTSEEELMKYASGLRNETLLNSQC